MKPRMPTRSGTRFAPRRALWAAFVVGIPIGVGLFTFRYAEGLSYFSNDPKACTNCHIMNEQYDSWAKSGHHHVAVCNDCHLPHQVIPKLIAKSRNGWNHSSAFTLQNFHEPIMISQKNAEILQENCLRCHESFVHDITIMQAGANDTDRERAQDTVSCVHCHKGVGHAPTRPTSPMSWIVGGSK
jgi:cytochrome c nitrite reductase small subunit